MKVEASVFGNSLAEIPARVQRAEALGYDGVTSGETARDPMLKLTLAVEHSTSLSIGTSVLIAFPRSPMVTAYEAWELQDYSKGRFLLGIGTQVKAHIVRRFSGEWGSPGPRLREYIESLRAIWDCWQNGTKLNYEGKFYRFNLMTPYFTPGPIEHPNIPIYISALNPYNIQLAGEVCDGLRMHGFNTPEYTRDIILPNLEKGAKRGGRELKDIDVVGMGFYITGANDEEIERQKLGVRERIAFYGSTPAYRSILDHHGWGDVHQELHLLSREGRWKQMAELISDDMLEVFTAMGTYDEIADRLKERWGSTSTRLGFEFSQKGPEADERLKEILKQLRE